MHKPMLAADAELEKLRFPLLAQPKIDGVRAVNFTGKLTGRSLKEHANRYVTKQFTCPLTEWFDGEMCAARTNDPALCRLTTSALNTIAGEPWIVWWLFDWAHPALISQPYHDRYRQLEKWFERTPLAGTHLEGHIELVPSILVNDLAELQKVIDEHEAHGYEGTITRRLDSPYKFGRSTVREGGLLRIKQFVDFEVRIKELLEGNSNQNEAMINELGHTERSTNQENMVPNGMVGAYIGVVIADVKDHKGKIMFKKGDEVKVSAGCMTHGERTYAWQHPEEFVDRISKVKTFLKGVKDKPRFPTHQVMRAPSDM